MTATLCHLARLQCGKEVAKELPAVIRDATLSPPSSPNTVYCDVVIHHGRVTRANGQEVSWTAYLPRSHVVSLAR
jgi:hypothetical protein